VRVGLRRNREGFFSLIEPFLFYPYCELCEGRLAPGERIVCSECWDRLPVAGARRGEGADPGIEVAEQLFRGRFSLWEYSPEVEQVIHLLKYRNRPVLADEIGRRMAAAGASYLRSCEVNVLVPVPLHRARRHERGYNQSELLARCLGRTLAIDVADRALIRRRYTRSQATLSREERLANVRGAFAIREGERIRDQNVGLVDDVVTTGSTAAECARVLLDAGARAVVLVTAATA